MVSQLLFGEMVEILEQRGKHWVKVRTLNDELVCWASSDQLTLLNEGQAGFLSTHFAFALDFFQPVFSDEMTFPIPFGARLPGFDGLRFRMEDDFFSYSGQAVYPAQLHHHFKMLPKLVRRMLKVPFLPGGRSPFGVDCAGFIQLIFMMLGYKLPRQLKQQLNCGIEIDFFDEAQVGDLLFFQNSKNKVTHAGILFEPNLVIHPFGAVRIDKMDHFGIFNTIDRRYTHKLRLIRRIFPTQERKASFELEEQVPIINQGILF